MFITVLNNRQLRADSDPQFQCYQTTGETTPRTYARYVRTRGGQGDTYNLPPFNPQAHCCERDAQVVKMQTTRNNGFGAFYCRGTQPNKPVTTVPTILLRSNGRCFVLAANCLIYVHVVKSCQFISCVRLSTNDMPKK